MRKRFSPTLILSYFHHFPATLGSIWLFTLLISFTISRTDPENLFSDALLLLFLYGTGSFLIEALFLQHSHKKWYVPALIGNLLPTLALFYCSRLSDTSPFWEASFPQYLICYFFILFFTALYVCCKRLDCSLEEYLVRVFGQAMRYHITYFFLLLGMNLILGILYTLFSLDIDLLSQSNMLLFGFYYMSAFLLSFYPQQPEEGRLTGILIRILLTGMLIIAYAVLYAYIGKLLFLRELPSNSLFRIAGGLFALGIPICMMNGFYKDRSPLYRISKWLPLLFLPFLFLQCYSIGIRIYENGITALRYVAVILLLFEGITLLIFYCKSSRLRILLLLIPAFSLLLGILPFVNVRYVSYLSQRQVIQQYLSASLIHRLDSPPERLDSADLPPADRVQGAYSYLSQDYYGKRYLDALSKEECALLEQITQSQTTESAYPAFTYYHAVQSAAFFQVSDYTTCYPVSLWEHFDTDALSSSDSQAELHSYALLPNELPGLTIPMNQLLTSCRQQADETADFSAYLAAHPFFAIDQTHALYLQELSFTYEDDTGAIRSFDLKGYLLEKE